MQVTYTAQELFEHMQSFDTVRFASNQNEDTMVCARLDVSAFRLLKRGDTYSIVAEISLPPYSKVQSIFCCLNGNEFLCEASNCLSYEVVRVKMDNGKYGIKMMLEK